MSHPSPEQNEEFALIIDTSSSAGPDLEEVRETAHCIYSLASAEDSEQFRLFMLGSTTPILPPALKQTSPSGVGGQTSPCSLIAPIMETLVREGRRRSIIIVGNGEIFDLNDWVGDPRLGGWLLVRTGAESLQRPGGQVSEITSSEINVEMETLLTYFSWFTREAAGPLRSARDRDGYSWRVDPSGYPLIFVEPLGAYVQLFPVTKPQFEKFLASGYRPDFDDKWYTQRLSANPRASYWSTHIPARERLFMTDVTTEEVSAFGRWLGRGYGMLSAEEWHACYEWFSRMPAPSVPPDLAERLSQDALGIWNTVEEQWLEWDRSANLLELSLMTRGILEWVVERTGRYCGLGEPAASKFQRKAADPVRPTVTGTGRLRNLGLRLRAR